MRDPWRLVGLDVRLPLLTLEAVVFITQTLVLGLQLAHQHLLVFHQVEQQANGAPRTNEVLNTAQVNRGQRFQRAGLDRTIGPSRSGWISHSCSLSHPAQLVYEHRP